MAPLPQHKSAPDKPGLWGKAGRGVGSRAGEREGRIAEGSGLSRGQGQGGTGLM